MSCKLSTAPINLPKGINTPCKEKCDLSYDYGSTTDCSVTNMITYLSVSAFSGTNNINFSGIGQVTVDSVKLFRPSLNKWDGQKADAEIIITHSGSGKNLYICIPIKVNESESLSAKWFSQIIPFSPTEKRSGLSIGVQGLTLNDIMPRAGFCVYEGGTFDWGCNTSDTMIIFQLNNAINMKRRDYRTLGTLINRASYNCVTAGGKGVCGAKGLVFNAKGTAGGPGSGGGGGGGGGKSMTCVPVIGPDGKNVSNTPSSLPWEGNPAEGVDTSAAQAKMWKNIGIVLAVVGGICLMWLLGWAFKKLYSRGGGGLSAIQKKCEYIWRKNS